jgi:hypothetical protein
MDLIRFMELRLSDFEKKGDHGRADKLREIIIDYKAMLDREHQALSSF